MAKSKKPKPSFEPRTGPARASDTGWVYRSDTAPETAPHPRAPVAAVSRPPEAPAAVPPDVPLASTTPTAQQTGALKIVRRYAQFSVVTGLLPILAVDMAALAALQVTMLGALARHYGVPFTRDRGKAIVGALVGATVPIATGQRAVKYLLRLLPGAGQILSLATVSTFASAGTYALGRVFVAHFESGGTLLDFSHDRARAALVTPS
jgi:uncharacterized protein (DUF697 family)